MILTPTNLIELFYEDLRLANVHDQDRKIVHLDLQLLQFRTEIGELRFGLDSLHYSHCGQWDFPGW